MRTVDGRYIRTVACVLALAAAPAGAEVLAPDQVNGLVAWYELESVHRHSRDGDSVERWSDSSGNGHNLVGASDVGFPVFRIKGLNDRPTVSLRRTNRFNVAEPFDLDDHTIFIVYATELNKRAFVSSETNARLGIVLQEEARFDHLQDGSGGSFRYNRMTQAFAGFRIMALGRQRGSLKAFVNGRNQSSGLSVATPLRVGRLFQIRHTTYVTSDGGGMTIAEMIFYDRHLEDAERNGITRYLSEKFDLPVSFTPPPEPEKKIEIDPAAVQLRASTRSDINVNDEIVAIPWSLPGRIDGPFHFDSDSGNTELHSRDDGARLRVTVTLPLRTQVADAKVRLLLLINRERYLAEEAVSEPFAGQGVDKASELRLQAELTLDNGDFFEVITTREGGRGPVRMPAGEALLIIERIE